MNKNRDPYTSQFNKKESLFLSLFSKLTENLDCYPSPISNFRTRAEFGVYVEDSINFTMVKNNQNIYIDKLHICDEKINQIIKLLKENLIKGTEIKKKLFQVEIQVSRNGEGMVTLIYHKSLDSNWIYEAKILILKFTKKL